jgi:hypothetical protein
MAQPPQTEAVDGGANIAQLCAAQKLLYADAIAPPHPQNAAEASTMENLKPLQLGGLGASHCLTPFRVCSF